MSMDMVPSNEELVKELSNKVDEAYDKLDYLVNLDNRLNKLMDKSDKTMLGEYTTPRDKLLSLYIYIAISDKLMGIVAKDTPYKTIHTTMHSSTDIQLGHDIYTYVVDNLKVVPKEPKSLNSYKLLKPTDISYHNKVLLFNHSTIKKSIYKFTSEGLAMLSFTRSLYEKDTINYVADHDSTYAFLYLNKYRLLLDNTGIEDEDLKDEWIVVALGDITILLYKNQVAINQKDTPYTTVGGYKVVDHIDGSVSIYGTTDGYPTTIPLLSKVTDIEDIGVIVDGDKFMLKIRGMR